MKLSRENAAKVASKILEIAGCGTDDEAVGVAVNCLDAAGLVEDSSECVNWHLGIDERNFVLVRFDDLGKLKDLLESMEDSVFGAMDGMNIPGSIAATKPS